MTEPQLKPNSDPEAPVLFGTQLADDRNLPPAEEQRLKTRAQLTHEVALAARRWAKAFDEYDQALCRRDPIERVALDYGAAQADLRDAVRELEAARD